MPPGSTSIPVASTTRCPFDWMSGATCAIVSPSTSTSASVVVAALTTLPPLIRIPIALLLHSVHQKNRPAGSTLISHGLNHRCSFEPVLLRADRWSLLHFAWGGTHSASAVRSAQVCGANPVGRSTMVMHPSTGQTSEHKLHPTHSVSSRL